MRDDGVGVAVPPGREVHNSGIREKIVDFPPNYFSIAELCTSELG